MVNGDDGSEEKMTMEMRRREVRRRVRLIKLLTSLLAILVPSFTRLGRVLVFFGNTRTVRGGRKLGRHIYYYLTFLCGKS